MPSAAAKIPSLALNINNPTVAKSANVDGPVLTWVRVKRFAHYFFAATFAIAGIGVVVYCFSVIAPIVAGLSCIPLFLSSYLVFQSGSNLWDYDDPNELQEIRQKALEIPILELIALHGWKNFFEYQFLSPKNFSIAFSNQAESLDLNALMHMHKRAQHALLLIKESNPAAREYFVPDIKKYKERFGSEARGLPCDELLKKYPIEELQFYGFITKEEARLLSRMKEKYQIAVKECRDQIAFTEAAFADKRQIDMFSSQTTMSERPESSFLQQNHSKDLFSTVRKHLGLDILSANFDNGLTMQQREQRLSALYFHEKRLKQKIDAINAEYTKLSHRRR